MSYQHLCAYSTQSKKEKPSILSILFYNIIDSQSSRSCECVEGQFTYNEPLLAVACEDGRLVQLAGAGLRQRLGGGWGGGGGGEAVTRSLLGGWRFFVIYNFFFNLSFGFVSYFNIILINSPFSIASPLCRRI